MGGIYCNGEALKKRVAFIVPTLRFVGQAKQAIFVAKFLAENNFEIKIFTFDNELGDGSFVSLNRVGLKFRPLKYFSVLVSYILARMVYRPKLVVSFGESANLLNIITSYGTSSVCCVRENRTARIKLKAAKYDLVLEFVLSKLLPKADILCVQTEAIARSYEEFEDVRVIGNCYAVSNFNLPNLTGQRRYVNIGRISPQKNQMFLLEVLKRLVKIDSSVVFEFYGGVEDSLAPYKAGMIKFIEENYLWDNVIFHGHVDEVWRLLDRNSVLLFPSRWEGYPSALVEALLLGCTFVCNRYDDGIVEVLGDEFRVLDGGAVYEYEAGFVVDSEKLSPNHRVDVWCERIKLLAHKEGYKNIYREKFEKVSSDNLNNWLKLIEEKLAK